MATEKSVLPYYSVPSPAPGNHWSDFCPYIALPSSRTTCKWNHVVYMWPFSVWLLSLNITHLRCIQIAAWISHSLTLLASCSFSFDWAQRCTPTPTPRPKISPDILTGARVPLMQSQTCRLGYLHWLLPRNQEVLALTCTQGGVPSADQIALDNQWWW